MDQEHPATARQNRTREHLKQALIELIKDKGYHAVTVKNIVDHAAYNRSTFYIHYPDKIELAEDLLVSMLKGLEEAVGIPYMHGHKFFTAKLNTHSFNIVSYIYKNRHFFELIKHEDTLPGLHTRFPQTILKIYKEQFVFDTINHIPVNMDYFKRYTAYGFYGLILNWIRDGFKETQEEFIKEVIELTKTHIYSFEFIGNHSHKH
ncbi:TetR/AcrR family transcriptional regulator [Niallia taxi]|uniref:TetR/AcrR family transcriptional regulator n=1 Tax=Niallia taxi TaxID=2499688 RepID=A0A3S2TUE0_9BACI|nr:TetR/AcrR family transcriptional regulator [Niallia taxi]MCM3217933.1 TetR/AcrR family transcriptional regulator [Niallia taxi]MDK8641525.1 TetR/AcrR family transcriptional regulator [Niallia taxi]MED4039340.1 TetR/AcrR family transcriptional regulator [Niallia taxi]MED4055091.1 TetR/AcrR family transcriptional regulator [Niallia taxi]MED4121588.1 TetR/AcrR family transcriptional regulator [Niallia taxi]